MCNNRPILWGPDRLVKMYLHLTRVIDNGRGTDVYQHVSRHH